MCSGLELVLGLGTNHTISIEVFGNVSDNIGFDVEGSTRETILNSLNCQGYLAKDTHLVAAKVKLLTLKIGHLETQAADEIVVYQICSWGW